MIASGKGSSLSQCAFMQVMVELGVGFKMGVVKYIGETEFAPGVEWIGIAFDKPNGKQII